MQETPPGPMVLRYFLIIFLAATLLVGWLLWPFLAILIFSYLLTTLFKPVYKFFSASLSASLASFLTCLLIILLVFLPLTFFVLSLSQEALHLYQSGKISALLQQARDFQHSDLMVRLLDFLASFGIAMNPETVSETLAELAKIIGLFLYEQASSLATNLLKFLVSFLMMILVIFFLLIDHERLIQYLLTLSPLPDDQERRLVSKFEEIAGAVLIGNGICGLIQGVLGGLLFAFFDLGAPVLWGGIMAVLAFLPIFGIGLVLIPAGLLHLLTGSVGLGLFVLFFYVTLSFSVEYLLKPRIVGQQVQMHTLLVFLSIMGGLSSFGFMGIIYGPLIITAFLTLAEIYMTSYDKYVKAGPER
jgi:predicted PurR-regulated permease PerM